MPLCSRPAALPAAIPQCSELMMMMKKQEKGIRTIYRSCEMEHPSHTSIWMRSGHWSPPSCMWRRFFFCLNRFCVSPSQPGEQANVIWESSANLKRIPFLMYFSPPANLFVKTERWATPPRNPLKRGEMMNPPTGAGRIVLRLGGRLISLMIMRA